jgi:hypothetical protein
MLLGDEENCNTPISYSDPPVHSIIPAISKVYNKQKQQGFVLGDERRAANLWVCGTELATLYPNFNYVSNFRVIRENYCKQ